MARGKVIRVTVTQAERAALEWAEDNLAADLAFAGSKHMKAISSLIAKVEKAATPSSPASEALSSPPLSLSLADSILQLHGGKNYAPWAGGNAALMVNRMKALGVTALEIEEVAVWLGAQNWIRAPFPLGQILNKWDEYRARAKAGNNAPAIRLAEIVGFE